MLRKIVRLYYRLRYFPRHIFSAFNELENSVSQVAMGVSRLTANEQALRDQLDSHVRELVASHARELADVREEVASLGPEIGKLRNEIVLLAESVSYALAGVVQEMGEFRDSASIALLTAHRRVAATDEAVAQLGIEIRRETDIASSRATATDEAIARLSNEIKRAADIISSHAIATDEAVARLSVEVRREGDIASDLNKFVRLQARLFPSWMWSAATAAQVRSVLSLLRPSAAQGVAKVRIGRDFDGGYVMLDDFAGIATALSLGISDDVSWDSDIAERGIRVLQFDQTIDAPPVELPLFEFERLRISPFDESGSVSVGTILRTRVSEAGDTLLLKMDIEGAEWDIYLGIDNDDLCRFKQIVCEFHELDRLSEEAFADRARRVFEKLTSTHFVCHVHGNNCANFANVANVPVPQSLEITFASRAYYDPEPTAETFPTMLDRPNEPGRADLYLGHFCFEVS